ncbi:Histidine protein methyltransferase 1 [Escovopsis weberi]|uniref:protein-histidine N-methyltransferase n=1 Tax=Escovopsis weberi TaxID=150374 RepID=A0A0N0RTQ4_ESCWE|nr:Histidine protein methyltransferase 1 [Escovopsis weberi]
MSFSFGFSGDDIENDQSETTPNGPAPVAAAASSSSPSSAAPNQAFPVPGKPQLPATQHNISDLLASLPSKIAYSLLDVDLDGARSVRLPRRELWDVRVQIMAEDDEVLSAAGEGEDLVDNGGLGRHDVKTGIYEGGFKSWESSVDLVKVLAAQEHLSASLGSSSLRVIELGCGTGLPSLALFQWIMAMDAAQQPRRRPCHFVLADYNPSVLRLVTLPNLLLSWALAHPHAPALADAFSIDGELEISPDVLAAFERFLADGGIRISFLSGAWSPQLLDLLYGLPAFAAPEQSLSSSPSTTTTATTTATTLLLGAETIYSPFALQAFTEVLFAILERERGEPAAQALAYVAAKRLYFGVGGSLTDFVDGARARGALVTELSEETEGVRRGVVSCVLP